VVPTSEKPYRVYRQPRRIKGDGSIQWGDVADGGRGPRHAGAGRRVLRFVRRAVFVVLAVAIAWGAIAFLSFRGAVQDANDRLPDAARRQLAPTDGPAIAASQVTMLVGADTSAYRKRTLGEKGGRADTIMLMRVDVPSRTVSMLSIPRDLYVEIPGFEADKINAAYAEGGLALSIRTVHQLTGVDINHVAQVDFDGFKEVIDALGGITIDNPYLVRSGTCGDECEFDGRHWTFAKGELHLDGRRALAYARIRKVDDVTLRYNEQEGADLGRARRQQRVIDAMVAKLASSNSLLHPRGVPRAVVGALATDISASEMLSFAFGKWWSKPENNLRCRLGGDDDGTGSLIPDSDNRAVVRMFLGKQAPVPPDSALAPGCVRESNAKA
jgi:LCP family protein required for cell wall assembly